MFRTSWFLCCLLLLCGVGALSLPGATMAAPPPLTMPDNTPIAIKFHNGPVLKNVLVQTVFLGDWSSPDNAKLRQSLNSAVDTIVTSNYLDVLSLNYNVGHGKRDSDVVIPWPGSGNSMTNIALAPLISGWVNSKKLAPMSENRLYVIYLQPGFSVTPWANQSGFGFHSWNQNIPYAVINTTGANDPNTPFAFDGVTSVSSHEIAEAATNPTGHGWFSDVLVNKSQAGGYNPEIGDFTDGAIIDGKQYPFFGVRLKSVFVQLLIDPSGNVISIPGSVSAGFQRASWKKNKPSFHSK
jgi:hypothetical protein